MDHVSSWYKRRTQTILLVLAFVVTVLINVSSLAIATQLSRDATLRSALVAQAPDIAKEAAPHSQKFGENISTIKKLGLPIGWSGVRFKLPQSGGDLWDTILLLLFGWSLTAFAVSLGALIWFYLLKQDKCNSLNG